MVKNSEKINWMKILLDSAFEGHVLTQVDVWFNEDLNFGRGMEGPGSSTL